MTRSVLSPSRELGGRAPRDVSAVVGLLGAIGQAFFDAEIEKRKLLHASQWSALIRLDTLRW